jgi:tRNA pseudouridine55 synthase
VILVGRATRLARFVEQQDKTYRATARLGFRTTTDDLTGEVIGAEVAAGTALDRGVIAETLRTFLGSGAQQPPAYSAKKVAGERSYRLARRGNAVELAKVPVTIHAVELLEWRPPLVSFRCTVSPGTYVRALARDLGERLGVGGHLTELRREGIGSLSVAEATPLEELRADAVLLPPVAVMGQLPVVELSEAQARDVLHGKAVRRPTLPAAAVVLSREGDLIAVAESDGEWLRPRVVIGGA